MIGPCCVRLIPHPDSFWFHHNPVIGAVLVLTVKGVEIGVPEVGVTVLDTVDQLLLLPMVLSVSAQQ